MAANATHNAQYWHSCQIQGPRNTAYIPNARIFFSAKDPVI